MHLIWRQGGAIQRVDAAIDRCGRLHVVYEDWNSASSGAVRMGYATWDHARFRPQLLHPEYFAGNLMLFSKPDGFPGLAFSGKPGKAADTSGWAMICSVVESAAWSRYTTWPSTVENAGVIY